MVIVTHRINAAVEQGVPNWEVRGERSATRRPRRIPQDGATATWHRGCGFAAAVAAACLYTLKVEPWFQASGATDAEFVLSPPIDELVTPGCGHSTRAIMVKSSADDLWSWLVQIGQDRAGFYSYTTLENLAGAGMRNACELVPEWQQRTIADTVWLADARRWHDQGKQIAALVQPPRALVLVSPDDRQRLQAGTPARAAWGFLLQPIDDERCRLIIRSSGGPTSHLFELAHFIMEQKMMRGLRDRAEHGRTRIVVPSD